MSVTYPTATLAPTATAHRWTVTSKDELGRALVEIDLYGAVRRYTYEGVCFKPATEIDAYGRLWTYTYDDAENLINTTRDGVSFNDFSPTVITTSPRRVRSETTILRWKYMLPYAIFMITLLLDIVSTYFIVNHFGGVETDPLSRWAFDKMGLIAMLIPVLVGTIGGLGLFKFAQIRRSRFVELAVIALFLFSALSHGSAGIRNIMGAAHPPTQAAVVVQLPASSASITATSSN